MKGKEGKKRIKEGKERERKGKGRERNRSRGKTMKTITMI